jgi:hypothetical protein
MSAAYGEPSLSITSPKTRTLPEPKSRPAPSRKRSSPCPAQIAFALRGEAADGGAVEGEVVPALDQEFLVVIQHVQAAFQIAEQHGDGLDALFVGQILERSS